MLCELTLEDLTLHLGLLLLSSQVDTNLSTVNLLELLHFIIIVHGLTHVLIIVSMILQNLILIEHDSVFTDELFCLCQAHIGDSTQGATHGKALDGLNSVLHLVIHDLIDIRPYLTDAA